MHVQHSSDGLVAGVLLLRAAAVGANPEVTLLLGPPLIWQCGLRQDVLNGEELAVVAARDRVHSILDVIVESLQDSAVALLGSKLELLLCLVEGLPIQ